jgi:alkylhydroperoxidase family enzyme
VRVEAVRPCPSARPQIARCRPSLLILTLVLFATATARAQRPPVPSTPRIAPLASSEAELNILKTMANHPKLAEAWQPFASYVLRDNTLPPRDRELLILRIGWLNRAEYEWGHHSRLAKQVGLTDEEILRVTEGPETAGWSSFERALLRAADELHKSAYISDRTWAYLDARYDEKQLMDVVFTVGQYNMVSWALRSFRVPMEEGLEGFPKN